MRWGQAITAFTQTAMTSLSICTTWQLNGMLPHHISRQISESDSISYNLSSKPESTPFSPRHWVDYQVSRICWNKLQLCLWNALLHCTGLIPVLYLFMPQQIFLGITKFGKAFGKRSSERHVDWRACSADLDSCALFSIWEENDSMSVEHKEKRLVMYMCGWETVG